ncbi:SRPBCC domain-containing protein [Litoribacter ruber]|uniref:SRPBCC domain-containing protein n=1 Tax=Litoribacter ruber TaxID=702568 RepID=A0AAP2CJP1_9BACT|nr:MULTISPECIES: SRPBCC domain-containing protein [Litoribacter]MBS9525422.1 SRPBCC domain-containing protein [Litoribacter alkaliphilus]MBT0810509.1 SRPBCC domain-containing protein [Litoribacter ruber]
MSIVKEHLKIQAPVASVWEVLLDPSFIPQWAKSFGEGIWVDAEWKKGGLVSWKNKAGEIIAKGIVLALERNTLIKVGYFDEAHAHPTSALGDYREEYQLESGQHKTLLTITAGPLPQDTIQQMTGIWKDALNSIKALAENR